MSRAAPARHPPSLHVEESGTQGDPIVFLHGFGATGFTWRYWVRQIGPDRRSLVVDLKGFGRSPKPRDGRYSPHDQADAVCRLFDDAGLENVCLVGHSLGGGIALLIALRYLAAGERTRLRRLVLVSSAALPQAVPWFIRLARSRALNLLAVGTVPPRHIVRWVLRQIVYDRRVVTRNMVDGYALPLTDAPSRRALVETARQIVPRNLDDIVAGYPSLDLPTLLLWGSHDRVVPLRVGERLVSLLPDARLVVLPQCGHLPPEEHPKASFAEISAFLETGAGTP